MWDGDRILYELRAPGGDTVISGDTLPNSEIENDLPSGGPNGLAYGVIGYTYGLSIDEPITIVRMGSTHSGITDPTVVFPHTGWRGMLALVTDSSGARVDCPFSGTICIPIDLPGANATVDRAKKDEAEPLSWFGSLASSGAEQSGLQYKRNRYYDPKRGQFTQADPIGLGGGLNLYGFASGDAVNFDDPFGLCLDGISTVLCLEAAEALGGTLVAVTSAYLATHPEAQNAFMHAFDGASALASDRWDNAKKAITKGIKVGAISVIGWLGGVGAAEHAAQALLPGERARIEAERGKQEREDEQSAGRKQKKKGSGHPGGPDDPPKK